jgi:hypothetical protein
MFVSLLARNLSLLEIVRKVLTVANVGVRALLPRTQVKGLTTKIGDQAFHLCLFGSGDRI